MLNKYLVSVGRDMVNSGKFYWDIKDASLEPIIERRNFESPEAAVKDLEAFKKALDTPLSHC